jgi:hypothetical protein
MNLLKYYYTDSNANMVINGFYEYHKLICNKEDCPAKRKLIKTTKTTKLLKGNFILFYHIFKKIIYIKINI